MHMWVRGERGGCGGNRGTVLDELAVEGREKEGEGVETPAYGSWHRRLDQQEGRIRGPLKHSVFGNQVFNVSGSCNGHQGYRVQTICPIAQFTVIIFIQLLQILTLVMPQPPKKSHNCFNLILDSFTRLVHWGVHDRWVQNSVNETGLKAAQEV